MEFNKKLYHIHSYFTPNEVLCPFCPIKIVNTIIFSKPILLIGAIIAQIKAENQMSPRFRAYQSPGDQLLNDWEA